MKKLIAIVFVLACVLGMAGCSIKGKEILHLDSYEWKMRAVMRSGEVNDEDARVIAVGEKDELYPNASLVDMILAAKDSQITLADITNNKTYTGSYKITEETSKSIVYEVVINGITGYATASPTEYYTGTEIPTLPIHLGEYTVYFIPYDPSIQDIEPSDGSLRDEGYFVPNYQSTNTLHSDKFLEILKRDGYYRDGEMDHGYNTDNITQIVNITPNSISDELSDVEIFYVNNAGHCFLMVNQTIYRYDTFGGYHQQLCLWDYDGNGTKDLVSYYTSGSGLSYLSVSVFDLTSRESINVISRMILSEPAFSFECKNGVIYIDGAELTYSDGAFHCSAFATGTP